MRMFFINTLFFYKHLKNKNKNQKVAPSNYLRIQILYFRQYFLCFFINQRNISLLRNVWLQIIPPVYSLLFLGVVKANEPDLLKEHGGHLELTEDWARHLLKSMKWVKRKGTTGKVEPSEKFLQEEKFSYQREISRIILNHDIPLDLVLNLDQTPIICFSKEVHLLLESNNNSSHQRCR